MKKEPKRLAVIKNAHTKAEMKALEQEFIDHKGPYLTLEQAFELARAHELARAQQAGSGVGTGKDDQPSIWE